MDLFSANIAYAASKNLDQFLANVNAQIINPLITLLFALALAFFLYGVFEFLANGNNDEKKTVGKSHMLWGVVGLTIMVGVWAILNLILNTIGVEGIKPETGEVKLPPYQAPPLN